MSSKKRWLEAGFKTYFDAKQAFGVLITSAIAQGVQPHSLLPVTTHEYLGWLLAGHPRWDAWSQNTVNGYTYEYFTLTSETSRISQLCLGFLMEPGCLMGTTFVPFSGFEALHGELRPLEDRVRLAYAKEVKLLLSERVPQGQYVERPIDFNHLDRLINEFGAEGNTDFYEDPAHFAQRFPYHIVDREYAAVWRTFVREASVQWGDKK
jgi:hypothetical protein